MKKKLFLLLLIIALAAFVFTGCTPPAEGEGEGEGEIEGVLVEFGHEYRDGSRVYVASGSNTVTVTFPAPVTGMVQVNLSDCTGDYSKGATYLFPNADRTVWTGSVGFECTYYRLPTPCDTSCEPYGNDCCATTVTVISGACEADTCVAFPVIVDCEKPYAKLDVSAVNCCCDECGIKFKSAKDSEETECGACPATGYTCCGDDCSGLASWNIDLYTWNGKGTAPFTTVSGDNCCMISPCAELLDSCQGTDCPIECVTDCLDPFVGAPNDGDNVPDAEDYIYAVVTLKDNVGNTQVYYARILSYYCNNTCNVQVEEYCCEKGTWTHKQVTTTIGNCSNVSAPCVGV